MLAQLSAAELILILPLIPVVIGLVWLCWKLMKQYGENINLSRDTIDITRQQLELQTETNRLMQELIDALRSRQ